MDFCISVVDLNPYLFTVNGNELWRFGIFGENPKRLVKDLQRLHTLDVDVHKQYIYMTQNNRILRISFDGNDSVEIVLQLTHICEGITVDWINRKLYWIDSTNKLIRVAEMDGSKQKILVSDFLDIPRAIAVDPVRG